MTNFIFGMQIKIEVFYELILSFWVCVTRHAESTQSNEFVISLQCLNENIKDEVEFLAADKHENFLEVDSITLSVCSQA